MPASNARRSAAKKTAARELVMTRILDAPRELVFKAWTEPKHVKRWMGPKGFTMPSCSIELRPGGGAALGETRGARSAPGGGYRWNMRSPDGADHWVQGVYREILKPERIVCTWRWEGEGGNPGHETVVTISLAEHGTKTKLTLHHAVFETAEACDAHGRGWAGSLDRLADYLAQA